jgi:hypothetical protein
MSGFLSGGSRQISRVIFPGQFGFVCHSPWSVALIIDGQRECHPVQTVYDNTESLVFTRQEDVLALDVFYNQYMGSVPTSSAAAASTSSYPAAAAAASSSYQVAAAGVAAPRPSSHKRRHSDDGEGQDNPDLRYRPLRQDSKRARRRNPGPDVGEIHWESDLQADQMQAWDPSWPAEVCPEIDVITQDMFDAPLGSFIRLRIRNKDSDKYRLACYRTEDLYQLFQNRRFKDPGASGYQFSQLQIDRVVAAMKQLHPARNLGPIRMEEEEGDGHAVVVQGLTLNQHRAAQRVRSRARQGSRRN